MDAAVAAALATAVGSIVIAAFGAVWSWKQTASLARLRLQLGLEEKEEERRWAASEALDRYREPLLEAAEQLGERIHNIQHRGFRSYVVEGNPRRETALLSTLFRIARYFGTLEMIYSEVNFLKFERAIETRDVADSLAKIGRTFATDRRSMGGSQFMIWREEQRAIGELSIHRDNDGALRCVGFATFTEKFEGNHSRFLAKFMADLESGDATKSERLRHLRSLLARLVGQLDYEKRYIQSRWMAAAEPLSADGKDETAVGQVAAGDDVGDDHG